MVQLLGKTVWQFLKTIALYQLNSFAVRGRDFILWSTKRIENIVIKIVYTDVLSNVTYDSQK